MLSKLRSGPSAVGFTLVGIALLWWAHRQWMDLTQVAAFDLLLPSARLLLWMLTLVVAGFSFGMVVSSARRFRARGRSGILLTLSLIPFAVLYYFWTQVTLGWFPELPQSLFQFLYSESTLNAASLILGFFLSGLVGSADQVEAAAEEPTEPVEESVDALVEPVAEEQSDQGGADPE